MLKGDVVIVAVQGDYGKPRPAVIFQSNKIVTDSILLIPITSHLIENSKIRPTILPSQSNGLQVTSQLMTDKMQAIKKEKVGKIIGKFEPDEIKEIEHALMIFFDLSN